MKCCFASAMLLLSFLTPGHTQTAPSAVEPASAETPLLRRWEALRYGMFIHFGMSTFTGQEFGLTPAPSTTYAPTHLDVEQWIRAARDAGMRYAVMATRHCYGHCLWPSQHTDYDVETATDKTDVVRKFVDTCRNYGIAPGFYYILGRETQHQPQMTPPQYEQFCRAQVEELLTQYGPIVEIWFDIPGDMGPDSKGVLARMYDLVKSLQPDCLVLLNQGNSNGSKVSYWRPTWYQKYVSDATFPIWPRDIMNGERRVPAETGYNPWIQMDGKRYYLPFETSDTILATRWFWSADDAVRSARQMYLLHQRATERGGNLLLNVPPDPTGRIPREYVKRLMEVKRMIDDPSKARPSLLSGCPAKASNVYAQDPDFGPQKALDDDIDVWSLSRWATDENVREAWLEVALREPARIDSAFLSQYLDRIRAYELQARCGDGPWRTIARGGRIGPAGATLSFRPVRADAVRLVVTDSTGGPTLWDFEIFGR